MDRYAVFGSPIEQSKSPQIHGMFAEQTGQSILYTKQLVDEDAFVVSAHAFFDQGGKGLNITMPCKHEAFAFAEELTNRAKRAGAVNTLAMQDNGIILGDTTDGYGLVLDISDRLGWELEDKKILILGAGGAVRGVLADILEKQPAEICVANRTESKAVELASTFGDLGNIRGTALSDLAIEAQPFDLIINATSLSLSGEAPPVPEKLVQKNTYAYDMVYGAETRFMSWARNLDCQVSDGLGMLVGQAAESFRLWRGILPDYKTVLEALRKDLLK